MSDIIYALTLIMSHTGLSMGHTVKTIFIGVSLKHCLTSPGRPLERSAVVKQSVMH